MLNYPRAILVFGLEPSNSDQWLEGLKETSKAAHDKNIPIIFATANRDRFARLFAREKVDIPVVACDFTIIRTAARTNPTVYLLKSGTIEDKFGKRNLDDAAEAIREF
jgi:hypothetical protein